MITSVTGIAQQQQVFPVSPPTLLTHSLQLCIIILRSLRRLDRVAPQLAGANSVPVVNPGEPHSVDGTGLGQLEETEILILTGRHNPDLTYCGPLSDAGQTEQVLTALRTTYWLQLEPQQTYRASLHIILLPATVRDRSVIFNIVMITILAV